MRRLGLLDMLQLAAGISMAGPMFVVGFELLRTGRPVRGAVFLGLGAFALYFPTYLVNRIGGPRAWIRRRLGRGDADETERDDESGDGKWSLLERLRR
ncbi:DUF7533 family protein [Halopiger goleimassiliensis]|uniref:DUF7533 family protein n=1 Tax=Halopiger goleimassiliensis TaxID=1293048 RepID=UPI0006781136|nr:hypothetical protein [Halopiger goleimassiliensis]